MNDQISIKIHHIRQSPDGHMTARTEIASRIYAALIAGQTHPEDLSLKWAVKKTDELLAELNK